MYGVLEGEAFTIDHVFLVISAAAGSVREKG